MRCIKPSNTDVNYWPTPNGSMRERDVTMIGGEWRHPSRRPPQLAFAVSILLLALSGLALLWAPGVARAADTTAAAAAPHRMSAAEMQAFLAQPLVARLATVRANGSPQITPMWYLWDDGKIYMSTRSFAAKVKHIRKNPRVAVVIDVMEAPFKNKSVNLEGTAEIVTTDVAAMTAKIRKRYLALAPGAHPPDNAPRVIIRITPKRIETADTTH